MGDLLKNLESVYARWERPGGAPRAPDGAPGKDRASVNYDRLMQKGRRAWSDQFGDYRKPQRRTKTRFTAAAPYDPLSAVGEFKSQPIMHPAHVTCRRPMMGRCCECLVVSKKNFYTDDAPLAGFRDILRVPQQSSQNHLLTRAFCHLLHTCERQMSFTYPDVTSDVINGMRVEEAIEKTAAQLTGHDLSGVSVEPRGELDLGEMCGKCRRRTVTMYNEMKAASSNWLITFTGWALLKILGRLLNSLVVHQGQLDMVRKAYKKNQSVPVVFLPLHRSHLDYIILTFVLWNWDIQAPYVAAGDNLSIPVFRWLLKGLGGFFIRRKLDRETGRKDLLYRSVLHGYMGEVLRNGQNMEFFLEGGRSRSGRVLHPKAGLLSVVTETFLEGTIPDAYLVPVSISYERIVDGDFTREQMGESKKKETFWGAMTAIFRVLRTNFGNARVDLGQPFSLQEYYSVVKSTNQSVPEDSQSESQDQEVAPSDERLTGSNTSLYGTDVVAEEQRTLVQGLAEHVVYNSMKTTAVMCTNLVAYILLTKFRKGVNLEELILNVDWLREEVMCRGRDVGFSGPSRDVIMHAVNVLGETLITVTDVDGDVTVTPCMELPHVLDLAYYANVTGMVFTLDSVMATAVLAACDEDLTVERKERVVVAKDAVMNNADFLTKLLKYEFLFRPPCTSMQTVLVETMEQFTAKQLLIKPESDGQYGGGRTSQAGQSFSFHSDSEDDDDIVVPNQEKLEIDSGSDDFALWYPFLWSSLAPVIEAHWVTACCLPRLLAQDMEESKFLKEVHGVAKERVLNNCASFVESMSYDTVKNALLSYQSMKVAESYTINGLKMISLCDSYTCHDALNDLIARVEAFRL